MDAENANQQRYDEVDIAELQDDPDLERIYADRLAAMQKEAEKRAKKMRQGHGELTDIKVTSCGPAWSAWSRHEIS